MFSKPYNALAFFLIWFLCNSYNACSKEFRIYNNGVPFNKQWSKIMTEINSIPEEKNYND